MTFKFIHKGFYMAEDSPSGDSYVVRTRPLNDGWMAINDWEGIVLATGQTLTEAKAICESYDTAVVESQSPAASPCPLTAMGDSDEQFESLIASYHTR